VNNERRNDQTTFIEHDTTDRAYFAIVPHLVLHLCRKPAELALWTVIKMVAGEDGECTLSTEQLGSLSMMGSGSVSRARQALLDYGLLEGEIRRDPGYPQPIWHLRIPDLWPENIAWRQDHNSLIDRIALKDAQREEMRQEPSTLEGSQGTGSDTVDMDREPSPLEGSEEPSTVEEGTSPVEGKPSRDDGKEEPFKKNQKEELEGLWEKAKSWLRRELPTDCYETWIMPARLLSFQGENGSRDAVITSPNAWGTEWMRVRLDVPIRRALAGVLSLGEDQIRIRYTTGE